MRTVAFDVRAAAGLVLAVAILTASGEVSPAAAQAPANDNFPGTELSSGVVRLGVDTRGATAEEGEPFGPNEVTSVWYTYTPAEDAVLLVSLLDPTAPAFFNVYTGDELGALTLIASGSTSQRTTLRVAAGERLALQIGATFGSPEGGAMMLSILPGSPPVNDQFPGTAVSTLPFESVVDTTFATLDPGEPSLLMGTAWYTFTAPEAMTLVADTWDSGFLNGLALVTEDTIDLPGGSNRGTFELCDEGRVVSRTFTIAAGEQVWFQLGGRRPDRDERGRLVFNLERVPDGTITNPRCRSGDPGHPLGFTFAPTLQRVSLAAPTFSGPAEMLTDPAAIVAKVPRVGRLSQGEGATLQSASATVGESGAFMASFDHTLAEGRAVTVQSWTKNGDFLIQFAGGPDAGVIVEQTYIRGIPALTVLREDGTEPGGRQVWLLMNGIIYSFGFEGFASNEQVLGIVERSIVFLRVGPPATGTGTVTEGQDRLTERRRAAPLIVPLAALAILGARGARKRSA